MTPAAVQERDWCSRHAATAPARPAPEGLRGGPTRKIGQVQDRREDVVSDTAQHEFDLRRRTSDVEDQRDAVPIVSDFRRRTRLPIE